MLWSSYRCSARSPGVTALTFNDVEALIRHQARFRLPRGLQALRISSEAQLWLLYILCPELSPDTLATMEAS